jgi:hypothetical protein
VIVGSGTLRPVRVAGPALSVVAFACTAATQLLGPSAAEPPLGRADDPATPPWHVVASPPDWLVMALPAVAAVAGVAVLALVLTGGWRPDGRRLAVAGVLAAAALSMLPPIGSADHLSYAAYGRTVVTGHDPYRTSPAGLAATGDPVAAAVEVPWQHTPSVYGPVATAEQALASAIAGPDIALTVWVLDLLGLAAFAGAALVLHRRSGTDAGRTRAAALWAANPLLWLELAAGAHLDVVVAALAIAAVGIAGRTRLGAGAVAGAAASVKVPGGLAWLALAWAWRRSRRDLLLLAAGALVVVVPGYAVAGTGAIEQLSRASRLVSLAAPWRLLVDAAHPPRRLLGALALVAFVSLVAVLHRRDPAHDADSPRPEALAVGVAATLAFAYVLTAPYALPWYDALPWVFVAATVASWRDWALLAHTGVLALCYLNRAATPLTGVVHGLTWGMRTDVAPGLLLALLVTVVVSAYRSGRAPQGRAAPRPGSPR